MIILGFIFCFLWLWFSQKLISSWEISNNKKALFRVIASLIAVWLSAPGLWQEAWRGYPNDSFFDLDFLGRTGVLAISSSLIICFYFMVDWKRRFFFETISSTKNKRLLLSHIDLLLSLALFGLFYAISPQAYYTFYQLIFPDLPTQIVIKSLFDINNLITIAALCAGDSLSHHLSGMVFLGLIPFSLLQPVHKRPDNFKSIKRSLYVSTLMAGLSAINITHC